MGPGEAWGAMGLIDEFREFAFKGNVIDMAVGIVLGVAFGNVVTSFVDDLLSPPLGLLLGERDLSNLFYVVGGGRYGTLEAARAAGETVIAYGRFLNVLVQFLLVAFALFLFVRGVNRQRRAHQEHPPETMRACPYCATAIPREASRCPACTSEVPVAETA